MSRTLLSLRTTQIGGNPVNTSPPSLTMVVKTGASPTVTPGTWTGTPSLTYALMRGAWPIVGPGASQATVEAYVAKAGDCKYPLTVIETDSVGSTFATSNAVTYLWSTPAGCTLKGLYDGTHVGIGAVTPGTIDIVYDQSGNGNDLLAWSPGLGPTQSVGGGANGLDAIDFAVIAGAATNVNSPDIGLTDHMDRTILIFGEAPAVTPAYFLDGASANALVVANSTGGQFQAYAGAGLLGDSIVAGTNMVGLAVFTETGNSKVAVNTHSAGAPGSSGTTLGAGARGITVGGYALNTAAQSMNGKMTLVAAYLGAMSDADSLDLRNYVIGLGLAAWEPISTSAVIDVGFGSDVAAGPATSWAGRKSALTFLHLAGGTPPAATGDYVAWNAEDPLEVAATAVFTSDTGVRVLMKMLFTGFSSTQMAVELSGPSGGFGAYVGSFAFGTNFGGAGGLTLAGGATGAGSIPGYFWEQAPGYLTNNSVLTLGARLETTDTNGVLELQDGGFSFPKSGSSGAAGANFGTWTLYLGNRNSNSLPLQAQVYAWMFMHGSANDSDWTNAIAWMDAL